MNATDKKPSSEAKTGTSQPPGESSHKWPPTADWALVEITVVLVLVTAALALYTAALWRATKGLAIGATNDAKEVRLVMAKQQEAMERQAGAASAQERRMGETVDAMNRQEELIGKQLAVMERQAIAAADAASAATANANAANSLATASMASERAFVYIDPPATRDYNGRIGRPWAPGFIWELYFINLGKTPAKVESMAVSFTVWGPDALEQATEMPFVRVYPLNFTLGAQATSGGQAVRLDTTAQDLERVRGGQATIGLIARLTYADVFGNRYDEGFIYRIDGPGAFYIVQNEHLNYTRKHPEA